MPANQISQQLNDAAKSNLIATVKKAVEITATQAFSFSTDFPGFIASATPATGPFGLSKAIAQQSCRRWARGQGIPSLPGFDAIYGSICKPYLDGLGETPPDGSLGIPFTGGQCAGLGYNVTVTGENSSNILGTSTRSGIGPVAGVCFAPVNQFGNTTIGVQFANGCIVSGTGQANTIPANQGTYKITNVVRNTGAADNCGNPPPGYDPGQPIRGLPAPPPITVNLPGVGNVSVDTTFNPDGSITVSLPGLGITQTFPNPFAPVDDAGDSTPTTPGSQGEPGDSIDVSGGDAADVTDETRNLVGVLVTTVGYPPRVNRIFNENESYTKGGYFVYFGGVAGLALNDSAAITRASQFFYAPEGCNRFRVVPNPGFVVTVTPHYEEA